MSRSQGNISAQVPLEDLKEGYLIQRAEVEEHLKRMKLLLEELENQSEQLKKILTERPTYKKF